MPKTNASLHGMVVSGFTFLRNGEKLGYPYKESIASILDLVDEFVVALGPCDDGTAEGLASLNSPKLKVIHTVWDDSLRQGGQTYALETDKAKAACRPDADWLFYLQCDEVIHERYLPIIKKGMQDALGNMDVEGLLFKYLHFYGDYDHVAVSRFWYDYEVRIVRNWPDIQSYKDAQGFRRNGQKLKVKLLDAVVYHYGWVKDPTTMQQKYESQQHYWHSDAEVEALKAARPVFEYEKQMGLRQFTEGHPAVMQAKVGAQSWKASFAKPAQAVGLKYRLLNWIEELTGVRLFTYRNFKRIG